MLGSSCPGAEQHLPKRCISSETVYRVPGGHRSGSEWEAAFAALLVCAERGCPDSQTVAALGAVFQGLRPGATVRCGQGRGWGAPVSSDGSGEGCVLAGWEPGQAWVRFCPCC